MSGHGAHVQVLLLHFMRETGTAEGQRAGDRKILCWERKWGFVKNLYFKQVYYISDSDAFSS